MKEILAYKCVIQNNANFVTKRNKISKEMNLISVAREVNRQWKQ
jgi:hypothetical protein